MTVIALHDNEGNVHGLIVASQDAAPVAGVTDPGSRVTEVDSPEELLGRLEEMTAEGEDQVTSYISSLQISVSRGSVRVR